jgi:hypothetical protein
MRIMKIGHFCAFFDPKPNLRGQIDNPAIQNCTAGCPIRDRAAAISPAKAEHADLASNAGADYIRFP